jgi:hypothetical protein
MGATLHKAKCCCGPEATTDCSDCETACNNSGDIAFTVDYTPCGSADSCAGVSGGSGTLAKNYGDEDCLWMSDENGAAAGDFSGMIHCTESDVWELDIWYAPGSPVACSSDYNTVAVVCVDGRPTGVFVVPITDAELGGLCGTATVTLTIP